MLIFRWWYMKNMAKKVTLDNVARMVKGGFDEINDKFDEAHSEISDFRAETKENFNLVDGRLDVLELELISIKKKLDNVIYRHEFELLKDKVATLEKRFAAAHKK